MNTDKKTRAKTIADYNKRRVKLQKKDANTPLPSLLALVKDWTFVDLARATGLHKASISNVMSGKRAPYLPTLVKMARALGYWNPEGPLEKFCMSLLKRHQEANSLPSEETQQ